MSICWRALTGLFLALLAFSLFTILHKGALEAPARASSLEFYSQWDLSGEIPIAATSGVDAGKIQLARQIIDYIFYEKLACRPDIQQRLRDSNVQIRVMADYQSIMAFRNSSQ
jgi:hypothetical protein